ncbi:protein of unknown function [Nitrospira defluvii]|uniref:Uncharacterized protein n=1 Tax=Nitrospira defluvii TaxID=330214 RepID=D8P8L8_9BACT|nr:protein of unknown function [Nitrospira defluvii]
MYDSPLRLLRPCWMVCLNSLRVMRLEYVIAVGSDPVARCRLIVTHLPSRSENLPHQVHLGGLWPECEHAVPPNRRVKIRVELGRAPG